MVALLVVLTGVDTSGETPLDCAPATLQYRMQRKMEEGGKKG